jgi:hypothetical protein
MPPSRVYDPYLLICCLQEAGKPAANPRPTISHAVHPLMLCTCSLQLHSLCVIQPQMVPPLVLLAGGNGSGCWHCTTRFRSTCSCLCTAAVLEESLLLLLPCRGGWLLAPKCPAMLHDRCAPPYLQWPRLVLLAGGNGSSCWRQCHNLPHEMHHLCCVSL